LKLPATVWGESVLFQDVEGKEPALFPNLDIKETFKRARATKETASSQDVQDGQGGIGVGIDESSSKLLLDHLKADSLQELRLPSARKAEAMDVSGNFFATKS
jgi:hypothetical protein